MMAMRTANLKVRKQEVWIDKTTISVNFLAIVAQPQHESS